MPGSFVRNLMEWFGLQGEQQPEQPVYFVEPTEPKAIRPSGRMTASLPPAYLAWLHQPIEWFEEWRRRMRSAPPLPTVAFDHDADFLELAML